MDALIQRIIKFLALTNWIDKGDRSVPYTSIETIVNTYWKQVIIATTTLFDDPV